MSPAVRLAYRPPYDFMALLDFVRPRALSGLEIVEKGSYARVLGPPEAPNWLRASASPGPTASRRSDWSSTAGGAPRSSRSSPACAGCSGLGADSGPIAVAFAGLDLTEGHAASVREVARAPLDGRIDLRPDRTLEVHVARWSALRGIGPRTAHFVALRALGHPDALQARDLVLRRAAAGPGAPPLGPRALTERAERWRSWRAYAVIHLWRGAATPRS